LILECEMALRNQPYIPLYVQDFLTDEKLNECSASATGVYIKLMCIMHKSEQYGIFLLKQKDKQTDKQIKNFALKLVKHLPYTIDVIESGLTELIDEGVVQLNDNGLQQKRMIHDNDISIKRSISGAKGGKKTQSFAKPKPQPKVEPNSEDEIEYENEDVIKDKTVIGNIIVKEIIEDFNKIMSSNYKDTTKGTISLINARLKEGFTLEDFKIVHRNMLKSWGNNSKMCGFLRPMTLYSGKFESYLNKRILTNKLNESGIQAYIVGQEWLRKQMEIENAKQK